MLPRPKCLIAILFSASFSPGALGAGCEESLNDDSNGAQIVRCLVSQRKQIDDLEQVVRTLKTPISFPKGTVFFTHSRNCNVFGSEWSHLDAADGAYIRATSKDDAFVPGQRQQGGSMKFQISLENLPKLTSILNYKAGAVPSQDGTRHVVITIGGGSRVQADGDNNVVGSPDGEGVELQFLLKVAGTGIARQIDVTPPFMPLTACQKD